MHIVDWGVSLYSVIALVELVSALRGCVVSIRPCVEQLIIFDLLTVLLRRPLDCYGWWLPELDTSLALAAELNFERSFTISLSSRFIFCHLRSDRVMAIGRTLIVFVESFRWFHVPGIKLLRFEWVQTRYLRSLLLFEEIQFSGRVENQWLLPFLLTSQNVDPLLCNWMIFSARSWTLSTESLIITLNVVDELIWILLFIFHRRRWSYLASAGPAALGSMHGRD